MSPTPAPPPTLRHRLLSTAAVVPLSLLILLVLIGGVGSIGLGMPGLVLAGGAYLAVVVLLLRGIWSAPTPAPAGDVTGAPPPRG